ncbi:MAG: patatin-like phospholipase family protein [Casimicrobiaceae bacterium]
MKSDAPSSKARPAIALALAGGGPLGAVYEVGALQALAEALPGLDFTRLHSYVGVSAGAFVAAGLANGIQPRDMVRLFIENEGPDGRLLDPRVFMRPAYGEYAVRMARLPGAMASALWATARSLSPARLFSELRRLAVVVPNGFFDNRAIEQAVRTLLTRPGRSNDFRELPAPLYVVATDLDSGRTVEFGRPELNHVSISRAIQASAALPVLYAPVQIGARYYVDGALNKTVHASVALDAGAKLVICINPLVPFDSTVAQRAQSYLAERGLPTVLSQTFRSLIHSRFEKGVAGYSHTYAEARLIVLEPSRGDADLFFANLFSYANRRRLAEHAYQHTRAELLSRLDALRPVLAEFGLRFNERALADPKRRLLPTSQPNHRGRTGQAISQLTRTLDALEIHLATR